MVTSPERSNPLRKVDSRANDPNEFTFTQLCTASHTMHPLPHSKLRHRLARLQLSILEDLWSGMPTDEGVMLRGVAK